MRNKTGRTNKTMKLLLFLVTVWFLFTTYSWAIISFAPGSPNVEEQVTFMVTPPSGYIVGGINWAFGDGSTEIHPQPSATHGYMAPGNYKVVATYKYQSGTLIDKTESTSIIIVERRNLTYTPSMPNPNQNVIFKANNFLSSTLRWNFGDGTIKNNGSSTESHMFSNPGTYTVAAIDLNGSSCCPVTAIVTVGGGPDVRSISYSPIPATTSREITFMAQHFSSACIKWNFGDGTVIEQGTPLQTHIFKKEGIYTVTAFDNCGSDPAPVSISLTVMPGTGPAAPFSISFIQLRFEDGKSYNQVSQDFELLEAFADIKYEGSGIFQAHWLLDDKPFRFVSQNFAFVGQETLRSGKNPPLPTQVPGIHEVTLNILQPKVEFKIPKIRYFVTPGETEIRVEISISKVEDLEGNTFKLNNDQISLSKEKNYLFSGRVSNISDSEISSAILQIFFGNKLFDQKMIRNLKSHQQIAFETSVLTDAEPQKKLKLIVFDTSVGGKALGSREIYIIGTSPPPPKAMLITDTLKVNNDYGPIVTVLPGQSFDVSWDVSSITDANRVKIFVGTEIVIGNGAVGTLNVDPSPPIEFNERRNVYAFAQNVSLINLTETNLGITNTVEVNAYDLASAMKTLPGLEIVEIRAEGPLQNDQVYLSIDLRNNSLLEDRSVNMISIYPCTEEVTKGPSGFDCSTTPAYSSNQSLDLPPGQIVTKDVMVEREDINLGFVHPHIPCDNIPVLFRVTVADNQGLSTQKYSPPLPLTRSGFDLGIMECEMLNRQGMDIRILNIVFSTGLPLFWIIECDDNFTQFVTDIRFHVKNCGTIGTPYVGPLPFTSLIQGIRIKCPDGDVSIEEGEEITVDCKLKYNFPINCISYAQVPFAARLEVVDDYEANNSGYTNWVINTHPDPFKDVKVKDVSVMNNHSSNPTIKFKVKNKSKGADGSIVIPQPRAVSGVSVRAFNVGDGNNLIWGPVLVGGDGFLSENEALWMYIPGSVLTVGHNTVMIEAYFSSGDPDHDSSDNQKTKNYHKQPGTSGPPDLKIKNVNRQHNNSNIVRIRFKVKNKGDSDSSGYIIHYLIDGNSSPFLSVQCDSLPAGAQREHFIGNGFGPIQGGLPQHNHTLKISVVSNAQDGEVNLGNNMATKNYNRD